jgi:amino acid transporter
LKSGLTRFLGPTEATFFIVAYTVGTAIFRVPGEVAANAGSVSVSLVLWVLGGLLTFCGALCYAELAVRVPRSGAEYGYVHAAYGRGLAFVFAWATLFTGPVAIAAVARGFADYLAVIWPMEEAMRRAAGAAAIGIFAAVSICSTPASTRLASIAASGKLLAVLALAMTGIAVTSGPEPAVAAPPSGWHLAQLGTAMVAIVWAYDGSSSITFLAGEVREPQRTLPISLFAGIGIVTLAYVLLNSVYFHALGFNGVAASEAVAATTLDAVMGPRSASVVAVLVMASALGTLAAQVVGNPRYFVGPAEDGLFPRKLAAVSPVTLTPMNAILLTAIIAMGLIALGGYELLIRLYVLSFYPLVLVALLGAMRLRLREGKPSGFSMPLYPLPLLIYVSGIAGICVASALDDPVGALFGLMVPATGAAVYAARIRRWPFVPGGISAD